MCAVLCCGMQVMWQELDKLEAVTAAERAAKAKLHNSSKKDQ